MPVVLCLSGAERFLLGSIEVPPPKPPAPRANELPEVKFTKLVFENLYPPECTFWIHDLWWAAEAGIFPRDVLEDPDMTWKEKQDVMRQIIGPPGPDAKTL